MMVLINEAFDAPNLVYTILMLLVLAYWLFHIIGFVGADALDFLDFDADADADFNAGVDGHGGFLSGLMQFFYLGQIPVVIIFTVWATCMWTISIFTNFFLPDYGSWITLLLAIPITLGGLIVTKVVIMPLAPYLRKVFDEREAIVEIVGGRCTVTSLHVDEEYGQAEMETDGAPILLNVRTRKGQKLDRGDEAVVFDHDKKDNIYLIAGLDAETSTTQEN